ncbi:MAG: UvrD-helicase domain-containing protein [Chloroflexi bacterium]|nr:UvrD-helicase domain-containing protein [Chloroflexota bacterium]
MFALAPVQEAAIHAEGTSFLLGAAGTGKTTALQQRLLRLLADGEPAYTLLVLVAEPNHAQGYLDAVHQSGLGPYADLKITAYTEMAQEMVLLFWPLVARPAGFARPYQPPTFLSYDLAQLLMWRIINAMLREGAFADLRLRPQQIVSQLLDTLNRAALNGLSLTAAIERQINTWIGEPERVRHLQEAATAVTHFRQHCLDHSLLDLSLAVEVFDTQLVQHPEFHRYFRERFRHLIVDNVEEQTPAGQNFVASLMPETQTTAVAYDAGGGYKRFMAADPLGANRFRSACKLAFDFTHNYVATPPLTALANVVENFLMHTAVPEIGAEQGVLKVINGRYRREMIAQLAPSLADLVAHGTPTNQIAIIVPYLDGALRYMLTQALTQAGLSYYLLRRRSSPREEPRIRAWLTWLALAHPDWGIAPSVYEIAEALTLSIHGLDPARASLLAERLYQPQTIHLLPGAELPRPITERIGADKVALVEELRLWLAAQDPALPIDAFLYNLFNDLLAQPRFQPEPDLSGAAVCDWLVQSATRLRQSAPAIGFNTAAAIGAVFIDGIHQGLVTANPPDLGDPPDPDGIMISTIYGYLLAGKPVEVQVWLETAATGWWDIPKQPLSNAFVLAQSRAADAPWTTDEEFAIRNQLLSRIIRGLTNRCTGGVILANSDLDRRGLRQDGPLWRALQPTLRHPK